jgi:flagellar assembly factor FliW
MENSPFKWLQSVELPDLAFIVVDPLLIVPQYPVSIDAETLQMIEARDASRLAFMAIVNVPRDEPIKMTANMKAPLVVNPETRLGRQIIIGSQAFSIHEPVFPRINERNGGSKTGKSVVTA